jgi:replicative DNA helicase
VRVVAGGDAMTEICEVGVNGSVQPPQDLAAEQSVLGAMLLSKDAITDVVGRLRPDDFYIPAHQNVYDTILRLHGAWRPD